MARTPTPETAAAKPQTAPPLAHAPQTAPKPDADAPLNALIAEFEQDVEHDTDMLFHLDRTTRQRVISSLQKKKGNKFVQNILQKLTKQAAGPTFGGTVFLPGTEHLGHLYTIEGDHILERPQKSGQLPRLVARLDAQGNYYPIGADGQAATVAAGKLSDLTGVVTQKGAKAPLTRTTGAGRFWLPGKDQKLLELETKDGGVFFKKQLVGQINASGHYRLVVNQQLYEGSLEELPPGRAQFQSTREVAGKAVEGLQVGKESVAMGVAYVNGTKLRVKNGQLLREGKGGKQAKVGEVAVVRAGTGAHPPITSLPYQYTDESGKLQSGDLLQQGEEQSVVNVGKEWRVRADGKWGSPGSFHTRGFARYGERKLSDVLTEMRDRPAADKRPRLNITDKEIDLFQHIAKVESSGQVQGINTYDNMVLSFGFKQWTLGHGELQKLIKRVPEAFKRYGIELGGEYTFTEKDGKKTRTRKVEGIKGASKEDLRGAYWAYKFFEAGLDEEIIAAEVEQARENTQGLVATIKKSPHLDTEPGLSLLVELDNNRPAYVKPSVERTLKHFSDSTPAEKEAFIEALVNEIVQEYYSHPNIEQSSAKQAMEKALGWTGKILEEEGYKDLAAKLKKEWRAKLAAPKKEAAKPADAK